MENNSGGVDSDNDITSLIEKTEQDPGTDNKEAEGSNAFSFAKIWTADKGSFEELADDDQGDAWAQTIQTITDAQKKVQAQEVQESGRGARRKAAQKVGPILSIV